jgi:hypothetical protein
MDVALTYNNARRNKISYFSPFIGEKLKQEIIIKELYDQNVKFDSGLWIQDVNHQSLRDAFISARSKVGSRIIHKQFKQ